jgi:excisionase family DNA binding protein
LSDKYQEEELKTKKLLTVAEASALLGLSRTTTYQLIHEGSLKSIKLGRSRRIPTQEIDAFLARMLEQCDLTIRKSVEEAV